MSGRSRHYGGLAAEEAVARRYEQMGGEILARRWRSEAGEIDLVVRAGDVTVFVEVKARRDHDLAAQAFSRQQWRRVAASAEVFMSDTGRAGGDMRFDLALVDRGGAVSLIENAAIWE